MTNYLHHTATYLEVRTDITPPDGVAVRIWIGWGMADASGRETDTIFGGYLDIPDTCSEGQYHHAVVCWLQKAERVWSKGVGKAGEYNTFIFHAIIDVMEVLGDA